MEDCHVYDNPSGYSVKAVLPFNIILAKRNGDKNVKVQMHGNLVTRSCIHMVKSGFMYMYCIGHVCYICLITSLSCDPHTTPTDGIYTLIEYAFLLQTLLFFNTHT